MSVSLPKMVWNGPRGLGSTTVKAPNTLAGKSIWEVKAVKDQGCSGLDGETLTPSTDIPALSIWRCILGVLRMWSKTLGVLFPSERCRNHVHMAQESCFRDSTTTHQKGSRVYRRRM